MEIKKAVRTEQKFFGLLYGISGSGKTYSALKLAKGFGGKIAFINTEHNKPMQYAIGEDGEGFEFDIITLRPPFDPKEFINAIDLIEKTGGYDTIIIDSITDAYDGEGGVLDIHNTFVEKMGQKNTMQAWQIAKSPYIRLMKKLSQLDKNVILCSMAKEYSKIMNDKEERDGFYPNCEKRTVGFTYISIFLDNGKPKIEKINCCFKDKEGELQRINDLRYLDEETGKFFRDMLGRGMKYENHIELDEEILRSEFIEKAHNGICSMRTYWKCLNKQQQSILEKYIPQAKKVAEDTDRQNFNFESKTSGLTTEDNEDFNNNN